MTRTYTGSCHCKAVTFEVDVDLAAGSGRCNCTWCTKSRNWSVRVAPGAFRLLTGADQLSDYSLGPHAHHRFCRRCGIHPFADGTLAEVGGDYVTVQLGCLDDAPVEALVETPITFYDGRADNWWTRPAEVRHL
ncbi:MAG: GFA family protein [Myxococcota bacterium]